MPVEYNYIVKFTQKFYLLCNYNICYDIIKYNKLLFNLNSTSFNKKKKNHLNIIDNKLSQQV